MPVVAVPDYLKGDFKNASPGLRFGMYLGLWGIDARSRKHLWKTHDVNYRQAGENKEERPFKDENKTVALKSAAVLNDFDRKAMKALAERQQAVSQTMAGNEGLALIASSVAPFTTGLGNEHPLENGFAFLNPYGLPYLPGSGVKGAVRRAAEELAHRDFFESDSDWTLPDIWHLFGFEPWSHSGDQAHNSEWKEWIGGFSAGPEEVGEYLEAVLDGASASDKELKQVILDDSDPLRALLQTRHLHVRGALEFWDVIPQINRGDLSVEIMTPHYSHYYQKKSHAGSMTPHDSGQPNPISFLTVPPDAGFTFHVRCSHRRLSRSAPNLVVDDRWKTLLQAAFEHAFKWIGFGAKTAVGYGAMKRELQAETLVEQLRAKTENAARAAEDREKQRLTLSPVEREIDDILNTCPDKNAPEVSVILRKAEIGRWTGDAKIEVARWLKGKMETDKRWKESSAKKNPAKDKDFQATLRVKSWLEP